jgi:hypothetical protein
MVRSTVRFTRVVCRIEFWDWISRSFIRFLNSNKFSFLRGSSKFGSNNLGGRREKEPFGIAIFLLIANSKLVPSELFGIALSESKWILLTVEFLSHQICT